jgi:hypothetical protein
VHPWSLSEITASAHTPLFGPLPAVVAVTGLVTGGTADSVRDVGMSAKDWVIRFHHGAARVAQVVAVVGGGGQ